MREQQPHASCSRCQAVLSIPRHAHFLPIFPRCIHHRHWVHHRLIHRTNPRPIRHLLLHRARLLLMQPCPVNLGHARGLCAHKCVQLRAMTSYQPCAAAELRCFELKFEGRVNSGTSVSCGGIRRESPVSKPKNLFTPDIIITTCDDFTARGDVCTRRSYRYR